MAKRASIKSILQKQKRFADQEMDYELRATGQEMRTAHEKVVRSWGHKPTFRAITESHRAFQSVKIVPKGKHAMIWIYVDRGTKPHIIRAKNAKALKFQTGYSARTAPIAKVNQGTGQKSGPWVQKQEVQHPGTEAREFSKTILKELEPPFNERINAAIQRGYNRANR